jgi:hypothetical protein
LPETEKNSSPSLTPGGADPPADDTAAGRRSGQLTFFTKGGKNTHGGILNPFPGEKQ